MKDIPRILRPRSSGNTRVTLVFIYVILLCFLEIVEMASRVDGHVVSEVGFRSVIIPHKTFDIFIKPAL